MGILDTNMEDNVVDSKEKKTKLARDKTEGWHLILLRPK